MRDYLPPYGRRVTDGSTLGYLHASPFIEHIDTTTVWKGLMLSDAARLLYLHRIFQESLDELLAGALDVVHKDFQHQCASHRNSDISALVTLSLNRQYKFSLSYLMQSIRQRLELSGRMRNTDFIQDCRDLLPLYLISCDCLMGFEGDRAGDTAVEIRVRYCEPYSGEIPLGPVVYEAVWIPDLLSFNEIHEIHREGQELRIIPRYGGNAAFNANFTPIRVDFFVESAQPWLWWDEGICGFRGNVPLFSELEVSKRPGKVYGAGQNSAYPTMKALRVEIKALLTVGYRSSIRLQRTIRARLTFKIIPWFAHESACAPNDLVRPFLFHHPECDSPAPSSRSSILEAEPEDEAVLINTVFKDPNQCLSARSSSISSTERVPATRIHRSPSTSPRKRRATSSLTTASPTKRHRESDDEHTVADPFDSPHIDLIDPDIRAEADRSGPYLRTSDEHSSWFSKSIDSQSCLSPLLGALHLGSNDKDEKARFDHLRRDSLDVVYFDEDLIDLHSEKRSTEFANPFCGPSKMNGTEPTNPPEEESPSDTETISSGGRKSSSEQSRGPKDHSSDERMIVEISQPKQTPIEEVCQGKSRSSSGSSISHSPESLASGSISASAGSRSRQSSITMEIITENSAVDHDLRRAQAMLWRVLSLKEQRSKGQKEDMCLYELKDMFTAMKLSVEEEKQRKLAKMAMGDVYDDVFLLSGSDMDGLGNAPSTVGASEASDYVGSGLEREDREPAAVGCVEVGH